MAAIEAQIVDDNGIPVPTANNELHFSINGPGRVAAVDSGSIVSHEPFQATERQAFQGRAVAYIRATASEGPIEVVAQTGGLASGAVQLTAAAD